MTQRDSLRNAVGVLLAGGRSRRFGAEKAVAPFRGATMMDAVAQRFAGCAAFAVSARSGSAAQRHASARGWPVVYDNPDHPEGPLAGVCAGLDWARDRGAELLAVAPCDAPLLPRDLFARLAQALDQAPAAYAVTEHGLHPLCALWRVALLAPLREALDGGSHPSVLGFLASHGAAPVLFHRPEDFGNANTVECLEALESTP